MTPTLHKILDVALDAAYEAGRITLSYFQTARYDVESKSDSSPVTAADHAAEDHIVGAIRRHFPMHAIIGEERGEVSGTESVQWIIDPIDGTRSFISGVPLYGVMIGVVVEGVPTIGVVNVPALNDMYWGVKGHGSFWNGRRARVSECASLEHSRLLTTDPRRLAVDGDARDSQKALYRRLEERAAMVRSRGDCYGHMLVATGRAEIMLDPKMSLWDCAAVMPIVVEAGGHFNDFSGVARIDGPDAMSTNAALHARVMSLIDA